MDRPTETPVLTYNPRDLFRLDPAFLDRYRHQQPAWGPLGAVVMTRTYLDFLHDEGRQETPAEALARCVETIMGVYHHRANEVDAHWNVEKAQRDGQEMFRRMWTFRILPAGRMLANLGRASMMMKGGFCLTNCAFLSTKGLHEDFARPFTAAMDLLMLGVGVGFDCRGEETKILLTLPPEKTESFLVPDTREGWVELVRRIFMAFTGLGALPDPDYSALRKKGEPLKTFGGVSSGPGPLQDLFTRLVNLCQKYVHEKRAVDSTFIADAMNLIGRCVVAGGVRRSSEIALGRWDDAEFADLKNPAALRVHYEAQAAADTASEAVQEALGKVAILRDTQAGVSVLEPRWGEIQAEIEALENRLYILRSENPVWVAAENAINAHPLRTHRWASNNSLLAPVGADYRDVAERIASNGEPGLLWMDNVRKFGRMADGDLTKPRFASADFIPGLRPDSAEGTNPCGEQPLESEELCCLVETFPGNHDSVEDWIESLKYAYLIGKAVTLIPGHDTKIQSVMDRNRRIGISITGIAEWYCKLGQQRMEEALDKGYRRVRFLDRLYSGWLDIPESIRLTTVKPSGCRPADALTTTSQGILTLEEMFGNHPEGETWADVGPGLDALQGPSRSAITKTYDNGVQPVFRTTLSYGLTVESTANHRWWVKARESRSTTPRVQPVEAWVATEDLRPGDILEVQLGTYTSDAHAPLAGVHALSIHMRGDSKRITQPGSMNPNLAWLLGYLWGDGAMSPAHYRIRFCDSNRENIAKAARIITEQFGLKVGDPQSKPHNGAFDLTVSSKHLWHWLIRNGVWKYHEDRIDMIPRAVRSSAKEDILAFFAGLLDSDGCAVIAPSGGKLIWTTADAKFADHIQHVAWAVGLGLGRSVQTEGASFQENKEMHHLTLGLHYEAESLRLVAHHSTKAARLQGDPRWTQWHGEESSHPRARRGHIAGKVKSVEHIGEMPTYDVEVADTHWYYAGSVKSHNTVGLLGGVEGGMRFPEAPFYIRTVRIHDTSPLVDRLAEAGHRVEPDRYAPSTVVAYFPMRDTRVGRYAKDVSVWEQARIQAALQARWSDNMVSATWTFQRHEAKDLGRVIAAHDRDLKGMSALPYSDHVYAQAPYTPCTEAEYNAMAGKIRPVNFDRMGLTRDSQEKFCDGGVCSIG